MALVCVSTAHSTQFIPHANLTIFDVSVSDVLCCCRALDTQYRSIIADSPFKKSGYWSMARDSMRPLEFLMLLERFAMIAMACLSNFNALIAPSSLVLSSTNPQQIAVFSYLLRQRCSISGKEAVLPALLQTVQLLASLLSQPLPWLQAWCATGTSAVENGPGLVVQRALLLLYTIDINTADVTWAQRQQVQGGWVRVGNRLLQQGQQEQSGLTGLPLSLQTAVMRRSSQRQDRQAQENGWQQFAATCSAVGDPVVQLQQYGRGPAWTRSCGVKAIHVRVVTSSPTQAAAGSSRAGSGMGQTQPLLPVQQVVTFSLGDWLPKAPSAARPSPAAPLSVVQQACAADEVAGSSSAG